MNKLQKVVLIMTALLCSSVIALVLLTRPGVEELQKNNTMFGWDEDAVQGKPKILDRASCYNTLEIPVTDGKCEIGLSAAPKLEEGRLRVNFTSSEENTMWLRLVVFDENGSQIGQSGLLRNGEYVESVKLEGTASVGQQIKAKILTYQTDTYYSLGSAQATLKIR